MAKVWTKFEGSILNLSEFFHEIRLRVNFGGYILRPLNGLAEQFNGIAMPVGAQKYELNHSGQAKFGTWTTKHDLLSKGSNRGRFLSNCYPHAIVGINLKYQQHLRWAIHFTDLDLEMKFQRESDGRKSSISAFL